MSEIPVRHSPRKLVDWINPTEAKKVHSLVDKVYKTKNLQIAWQKVKAKRSAGGVDGETIEEFGQNAQEQLVQIQQEMKTGSYRAQPVRQVLIPKPGKPGEKRPLGIPTIKDRVVQQAFVNRLEPIFEEEFDEANFGYRPKRSTKDALRKICNEVEKGNEWIVDADLKNFFGTVEHKKLMTLLGRRISDGKVLRMIEGILQAECFAQGQLYQTRQGTPQGGVISPMLSNILLTPFDKEMRRRGYRLTRYADDWVITCASRAEAESALKCARKILELSGVKVNEEKTRIVHVRYGFEFLGYKIKQGVRTLKLKAEQIKSGAKQGGLYIYPTQKSLNRFKERIKQETDRRIGAKTEVLISRIKPIIRGWGLYYCEANIRKLFNQLNRWIVRRIWSHKYKRWRCMGWRSLPASKLYGELGLVSLVSLIPSIAWKYK